MTFCTHRCGRIDWTLDKTWKVWYENIPSTGFDCRNWVTKLGPTTPKDWGLLQSPGATLWKKQAASWVAKSINLHTLVKQCQTQVGGRIHRAFAAGQVYAWPILQALGVRFYRFEHGKRLGGDDPCEFRTLHAFLMLFHQGLFQNNLGAQATPRYSPRTWKAGGADMDEFATSCVGLWCKAIKRTSFLDACWWYP